MSLSKITITKQPGETKLTSMDFSNKMSTSETIVSIVSVAQSFADGRSTTDLSFAGEVAVGQTAQFLVSGGQVPNRDDIQFCDYKVTVTITTSLGQILENDGILRVQED